MSFGGSTSELESPTSERPSPFNFFDPKDKPEEEIGQSEEQALARLSTLSPPTSSGPVIAVDLDDVLSQTNEEVAKWHNEIYGTNMDVTSFYYYYYWKNPFWGTTSETFNKVKAFYACNRIYETSPTPGSREGVQTLKDMGFRMLVVTARTTDTADESYKWVNKFFPGVFDSVICTGQFKDVHSTGHEVVTKLSKAQVCHDLGAKLLIDDSVENAMQCANHTNPTPVLLFGDYEWNKRMSLAEDNKDDMIFDRRLEREGPEFWKKEEVVLPADVPIRRARDWGEVVRWVQTARKDGRL